MSFLTGLLRSGARLLRRSQEDHWSFLFSQIAVYSFVVALVTGVFLFIFFKPSMTGVVYHGSYHELSGVRMSEAYKSVLEISFDVRGGLLMRQIHHWAALTFVAAVCVQLLRLYFTAAFRRPRSLHWLIWVTLLLLGMAVGWTGTILPDDMLSSGSLDVLQGVLESIPVVGTHLMLGVFGGAAPGHRIIPRLYWLHVLLPAAMVGLFVLRRRLVRRHGHPRFPGPAGSGRAGIPSRTPRRPPLWRWSSPPAGCSRSWERSRRSARSGCTGPTSRGRSRPERHPTGTWASWTARCALCQVGRSG